MKDTDVRERPTEHEIVDPMALEVAFEFGSIERIVGVFVDDEVSIAGLEFVD